MNWLRKKIEEIYVVWQAKQIWKKVEADEDLKNVQINVSKEDDEKVMAAIHEIEMELQAREEKARLAEEQELIRLGRRYKRSLHRRKYVLLAAVLVLALSFSINCFGSVDRMFHELNLKIFNREREVADTDGVKVLENIVEEEAFAEIEEMYGFHPVRLGYLPEGTEFLEMNILQEVPKITILYGTENAIQIKYDILANYRDGSIAKDIEDSLLNRYQGTYKGIVLEIKEYLVEDSETRWLVQFEYEKFYYWIQIMGIEPEEIQKIVENIHFS